MLFEDDVVIFNGHGNTYWIQNELGDEVTYVNILNHAQFNGESHAKLVFLNTCLAFQNVAPALSAVGVDCVVGFNNTSGLDHCGWHLFIDKICNEGMSARDAYDELWLSCADWQMDGAGILGDTELWGESL